MHPFKTPWAVVPITASTTQIRKHSRTTTEGVGEKKKSTIKLATINNSSQTVVPYILPSCKRNLATIVDHNDKY